MVVPVELQQEIPPNSWVKLENFEGFVMHRNPGTLLAVVKDGNIFFSGPLIYSLYGAAAPKIATLKNLFERSEPDDDKQTL